LNQKKIRGLKKMRVAKVLTSARHFENVKSSIDERLKDIGIEICGFALNAHVKLIQNIS
jgi:hypothetical protein